MARFGDNPLKNPLSGNEAIPAQDPSTSDDVGMTPVILAQFAQENMTLASGSTQGLISGPMADKLAGLYTNAQIDGKVSALSEVAIPIFIPSPVDGSSDIYTHVIHPSWVFQFGYAKVSAGSTNVSLTINGTPIGNMNNIPVTTAGVSIGPVAPKTLLDGGVLGLTLSGTTGNCKNLMLSVSAIQATP